MTCIFYGNASEVNLRKEHYGIDNTVLKKLKKITTVYRMALL